MNVLWFIPTHGDSRYLGSSHGAHQALASNHNNLPPQQKNKRS